VKLEDGMVVELGASRPKAPIRERLQRFVEYYPNVLTAPRQGGRRGRYAVSERFRCAFAASAVRSQRKE
jgi:cell division septal protein FtsQ